MLNKMSSLLQLFLIAPLLSLISAQVNFSPYPINSQQCLYNAADSSGCPVDSTPYVINSCLCSNGGNFITNSASCIGSADPSDLQEVWTLMAEYCGDTDTPIKLTESQFIAAAGKTTTSSTPTTMITTTSAPSTSTDNNQVTVTDTQTSAGTTSAGSSSPSGSSSSNSDGVGRLSGGKIALISCVATVAALLLTALMCCGCYRSSRLS